MIRGWKFGRWTGTRICGKPCCPRGKAAQRCAFCFPWPGPWAGRFLLPLAGALGRKAVFRMEGRLSRRPLAPLDAVLREHGMSIEQDGDRLLCSGQLRSGEYALAGNISSQYFSGLLMALPLLEGSSTLSAFGPREAGIGRLCPHDGTDSGILRG